MSLKSTIGDLPHEPGTYIITSEEVDKAYVGSASDLAKRYNDHNWGLKNNSHPNKGLQELYNKHNGELTFTATSLENRELAYDFEQIILDEYRDSGLLTNIAKHARQSSKDMPVSEEIRKKISDAQKGNQYKLGHKHSEETRRKISESNKGIVKNLGRIVSEETRKKISDAQKGMIHRPIGWKHTEESKAKMSEVCKGRVFTEEHKAKLSDRKVSPVIINGVEYKNRHIAAKELNTTVRIVQWRCISPNFPDWKSK